MEQFNIEWLRLSGILSKNTSSYLQFSLSSERKKILSENKNMYIETKVYFYWYLLSTEFLWLFGRIFTRQALEIEPNDKNCLVARSKCHLKLGDAKAALKDAEAALEDDGEFNKVSFHISQPHGHRLRRYYMLSGACRELRNHKICFSCNKSI